MCIYKEQRKFHSRYHTELGSGFSVLKFHPGRSDVESFQSRSAARLSPRQMTNHV